MFILIYLTDLNLNHKNIAMIDKIINTNVINNEVESIYFNYGIKHSEIFWVGRPILTINCKYTFTEFQIKKYNTQQ